jgi:hypothetical protein
MKRFIRYIWPVLIFLFVYAPAQADSETPDIGFVTLQNEFQAELVSQVLGHAYTKVGDRFLVSFDAQQQNLLARSGIQFEVILPDTDPATLYLVYPPGHPEAVQLYRDKLAEGVDIGMGMRLMTMSRQAASAFTESTGLMAVPLEQKEVRFHYLPPAIATALQNITDFPTDTLADLVSQDSLYSFDSTLEAFQTRYIWTDSIDSARDWIVQKFLSWGYTDVSTQKFWWGGGWHYNVMAVKQGYAEPDKTIVVGGHYDSITYGQDPGPLYFAPGADDNGSGTTTVLELARVLANVPLRKTVIFMAFSAEEVGLVGSAYAAQQFANSGTDIEVMYNYDMVGYTDDSYWDISVTSGPNAAYRDVTAAAAQRVTALIPIVGSAPGSSDHQSFLEQGFDIVNTIEADFNYGGWHTNLDVTSRMNFPYMREVAKMCVASLAIVAQAAHPTKIEQIVDIGDGQSLEIFWSDCDPTYTYTVYYGTSSGNYTDTVIIPQGQCSYVLNGLTEGQTYYLSVVGEAPDGYPAVYSVEGSETPLSVPRPPNSLTAEPGVGQISLDWGDNREADFAYYRLYRQFEGLNWILYQDNLQTSSFTDTAVLPQINHVYKVTAVDLDGNESDYSNEVSAYAATFDGGILVVDDITQEGGLPTQEAQEAYFDTIFGDTPFDIYRVETYDTALTRSAAGRYSSIFWFDDDFGTKVIGSSEDTLSWYAGFTDNLFVCGSETIRYWTPSPLSPGDLLYDEFGLSAYTVNNTFDFAGAVGQNGWPSIEVDTNNIFGGNLPLIPKLTPRAGATVIYTFDSFSDDPAFEGQPCGLLYQTAGGFRIILAFPLYHMNHSEVESLIAYAKAQFGETASVTQNGDVDGSGVVDFSDLVYMIDYFFRGGPPPVDMNAADVNASCSVNVVDASYLVAYLFLNGPEPQQGCVQ